MHVSVSVLALVAAFIAGSANGQDRASGDVGIRSPGDMGVVAVTPSRIDRSSREMNRGLGQRRRELTPAQARAEAEAALRYGGFTCTVAEAVVVGRAATGEPLIEVDCVEGGGLIIADSRPLEATDCLDIAPDAGDADRGQSTVTACRLPANVASVASERGQSARN